MNHFICNENNQLGKTDDQLLDMAKINNKVESRDDEDEQAAVDIWKYILGFTEMAVVKCAVELGIADVLESHGGTMTLLKLSSVLNCVPSYLHRIMRFLIHQGIFKKTSTSDKHCISYSQTPLSRRLMKGGDKSMAALILLQSTPVMLKPWHGLSFRIRANGSAPFEAANGEDLWKFGADNEGHNELFNEGMACDARVAVSAIIKECPEVFDGIASVVDVGGGNGTALKLLVKAFPGIRGINFDLPHVVSAATQLEGAEHVRGDMFEGVPKADAAFFLKVLHDWSDNECIQILRNCREAISRKVIIAEDVVDEQNENRLTNVKLLLDMVMLAHTNGGKERTEEEWAYVLTEAGFSSYTIKPTSVHQSIIEAFP